HGATLPVRDHGLPDRDPTGVEVGVLPSEADEFSASRSRRQGQDPESAQPIVLYCRQEPLSLVRRPGAAPPPPRSRHARMLRRVTDEQAPLRRCRVVQSAAQYCLTNQELEDTWGLIMEERTRRQREQEKRMGEAQKRARAEAEANARARTEPVREPMP